MALQFAPFASDIELPFYTSLASLKINHDKLDDSARKVLGLYEIRPNDAPESSCRMQILGNALTSDDVPKGHCRAEGMIKNVNTIEEYRNLDKNAILHRAGSIIWEAILDGTIYECPSLLASFSVISFADLKRYKFTYWFAFPALHSDPTWRVDTTSDAVRFTSSETTALVDKVQTWRYRVDARQHGFFLVKRVWTATQSNSSSESTDLAFAWEVSSLAGFEAGFFDQVDPQDRFVAFADPSTYPNSPGWMLRNLLVLVRQRWKLDQVQILCYREIQSRRDEPKSLVLHLQSADVARSHDSAPTDHTPKASSRTPKITGWERNKDGKLASKFANLAEYLDPHRLADQSVDLNLKLMKWRIAPGLDLDKIKHTKCLLLGSGTLGSYVARNLLTSSLIQKNQGWGVRKISFVDNANVSFSNPVRQPLFDFKDCLEGGAKKAFRAAEALAEIYPGVDSSGHVMSVPMAGHPITDEEKTRSEFEKLQNLIEEHDVIFLLMDTRESRWLPTVMGKAAGKIVMNAALGFDTFVVMRHGVRLDEGNRDQELGCYFCNDVVAPADSIKDQTLDQQCTVTRPGIAAIASALLVELLVSILQHADGPTALAPSSTDDDRGQHPLGLVPHQIRGYMYNFQNLLIRGKAYDCCSACSDRVVDAYRMAGWEFVKRALNEPDYVAELSGLAEVQRAAEKAAADIEWDEEEEEEGVVEDEGEGEMV
ncbi:MAG: Autophagy protein 7 [Peltula sp. TS41687]|nr:MAG: Autophagy protein 7 [Peltula sp. TS41687]